MLILTGAAAGVLGGGDAAAVTLRAEPVVTSGLTRPVFATAAPGVADSLFVLEQQNQNVKILDLQSKQISTFLSLPNLGPGGERGLKGLAFHPDYETNGKFYVHQFDDAAQRINILEFTRSASDPTVADPASQRTILSFEPHPTNVDHTAGWIGFSPVDGYLYIPTGDGGAFGGTSQTSHNLDAQDVNDIHGKVLRIDVNSDGFPADGDKNYAIPATNPFATSGGLPEVFAYGVRSPFRGSFDRQTGDFYLGDVGSIRFEEINLIPAGSGGGQNLGWRSREGSRPNPTFNDPEIENPTDPIYEYERGSGAAVIGGYVYRGSAIPEFQGHYLFADFVRDSLTSFETGPNPIVNAANRSAELRRSALSSWGGIASLAEDNNGELYVVDLILGDIFAIVEGLDGDYDLSGTVDTADYELWKTTFGETDDLRADGNRDGVVDAADYTVWRDNLGASLASSGSGAAPPANAPEPAAALLLLAPLAGLTRRRRP